jgi:hypothetical protein
VRNRGFLQTRHQHRGTKTQKKNAGFITVCRRHGIYELGVKSKSARGSEDRKLVDALGISGGPSAKTSLNLSLSRIQKECFDAKIVDYFRGQPPGVLEAEREH